MMTQTAILLVCLVALAIGFIVAARGMDKWRGKSLVATHECALAKEDLKYALGREQQLRTERDHLQSKYDCALKAFATNHQTVTDGHNAALNEQAQQLRNAKSANDRLTVQNAKLAATIEDQKATIERQGSQIVRYETNMMTAQRHIERLEANQRKRRS